MIHIMFTPITREILQEKFHIRTQNTGTAESSLPYRGSVLLNKCMVNQRQNGTIQP